VWRRAADAARGSVGLTGSRSSGLSLPRCAPSDRLPLSHPLLKQTGERTTASATLEPMRRALPFLAAAALAAVLVIGLTQAGGDGESGSDGQETAGSFDLSSARERLQGAPPPLAKLHEQSNQLLGGGEDAFEQRLRELRGHPVVINKWASWCGPCRAEFPIFQSVATARGREIAFLGVDGKDSRSAAAGFLEEFPLPYPSYEDPDEDIARDIGAPANYPVTLFVDARGETVFIHQGQYRSEADLVADIERWL
jgi:cytochrome c biogenesis protein CcmG, thiol:disulfide interchange protein DsbE